MTRALSEAVQGAPSPNPPVGAVVVRDGTIYGLGHHHRAGEEHAEAMALRHAGDDARGATVFVTLEPCNHHGRTAPCTEALVRAGVARVVFAVPDPNPHVRGHGREMLRAAGVIVEEGFLPDFQREAERIIAPWMRFITTGRAHVTLKAAMSLDGSIASRDGESRWITSEDARVDGHKLRARCDAILVGSGTVRADDPLLTVRGVAVERAPARVIVSRDARVPLESKLVATAGEAPTWVLCARGGDDDQRARAGALAERGANVIEVDARDDGGVDLRAAMHTLAGLGVVSVLCEGGGALHGALRDAGVVDRVVAYVAPMLLGGGGLRAIGGAGAGMLADATRLGEWDVKRVGPDLRIEAEVV